MSDVRERIAPVFPAGVDRVRRLMPLLHSAFRDERRGPKGEGSAVIRRRTTRHDPLLFALYYLTGHLQNEMTGVLSFSPLHLDIYDRAARWAGGGPDHSGWANPRGAGNTTSWDAATVWALAHGHRRFALRLMCTTDQAAVAARNVHDAIAGNGLLLHDFPHLRKGPRWAVASGDLVTAGAQRLVFAGLDKTLLGLRQREQRPDLIVIDDPERGEEGWTAASKAKALGRLGHEILPMGSERTAVVISGTPVATGSLMHDVVRAVRGKPGALEDRGEWVGAYGFAPYWHPALLDAGTPRERSLWETRWPLERLLRDRAKTPREFALQMLCDPDDPAAAQWWTDDERTSVFRYDAHFPAVWHILSIDGAVTRDEKRSDMSALVVLGVGPGVGERRAVCVERAIAGHWSRTEVKQYAWDLTRDYRRTCRTWLVDATGRGDGAEADLEPIPAGVTVVPYTTVRDSKRRRIETLFDDYCRGAIWHACQLRMLEAQMCAWKPTRTGPGIDDLIDAVRAGKDYALYGDASRAHAGRGRRTR